MELLNGSATVASWTHGGFRSRSCRVHAATRRIRVDGLEQGRQHTRLDDLYHFFVWDDSRAGILAGRAARSDRVKRIFVLFFVLCFFV